MKFSLTIIFLLISCFLFAQQKTKKDYDYIVKKGNDTTYCKIKRISKDKIFFIYDRHEKLYNNLSDVLGYKMRKNEFVKIDYRSDSSKLKVKIQPDTSLLFGLSVRAKENIYSSPDNFYYSDNNTTYTTSYTKTINANFNIKYKRVTYNVGGIFYCHNKISGNFLGQNISYNNKFGIFGYSIGINYFLNKYNNRVKSFLTFQYDLTAKKITDTEIMNFYPNNSLTGTANWKFRNHEIDLGYLTNIKVLKGIEINVSTGISLNTVILYNSNNKFFAFENLKPKYITSTGLFLAVGVLYYLREI